MHVGYTLTNNNVFTIPDTQLLLDTCSTCDVTMSPDLVKDIRQCISEEMLTAYYNGGEQKYNLIARLTLFPIDVHFKRDSMANIVSMKTITATEGVRVTMDTAKDMSILVTIKYDCTYNFKPYANGLYYFDMNTIKSSIKSKDDVTNYSLLQTVKNNKSYFTAQEIK